MEKLRVLDLFSGIGGFSLGLERTGGFETVAFCEIDPFCRQVLAKHWPGVPIFEDVRRLTGDAIGPVDVITGGYPCQPFSLAGQRRGEEDDRHLWPEMYRLVAECRPAWVIGENVTGHISMGLDRVLSDLENSSYTCRAFVVPAVAVDAKHRRDRIWVVADASAARSRLQQVARPKRCAAPEFGDDGAAQSLAHTARDRPEGQRDGESTALGQAGLRGRTRPDEDAPLPDPGRGSSEGPRPEVGGWSEPFRWLSEPDVGRVATGVPRRVDRLRSLGNAVVPQIPEMIGNAILQAVMA